jgi:hypothetical protein
MSNLGRHRIVNITWDPDVFSAYRLVLSLSSLPFKLMNEHVKYVLYDIAIYSLFN